MILVRCPRHAVESGSHKTLFRFPLHDLTESWIGVDNKGVHARAYLVKIPH